MTNSAHQSTEGIGQPPIDVLIPAVVAQESVTIEQGAWNGWQLDTLEPLLDERMTAGLTGIWGGNLVAVADMVPEDPNGLAVGVIRPTNGKSGERGSLMAVVEKGEDPRHMSLAGPLLVVLGKINDPSTYGAWQSAGRPHARYFPLIDGQSATTVGRNTDSVIKIPGMFKNVSGRHMSISYSEAEGFGVTNTSKNGVSVKVKPVEVLGSVDLDRKIDSAQRGSNLGRTVLSKLRRK